MNKTVQSILSLTAFSALLIVITLFCGGLGFGRLFEIYGIMEYCFLGLLLIIDVLLIYKVYKLYAMQPKAIVLLLGLECCSILLWIAFICIDQSLLDCLYKYTINEREKPSITVIYFLCSHWNFLYPLHFAAGIFGLRRIMSYF